RHVPARLVRKVAREVDRLADDAPALGPATERPFVRAGDDDEELFYSALLLLDCAVLVRLEESDDRALDRGRRDPLGVAAVEARDYADRLDVTRAQSSHRRTRELRDLPAPVITALAHADQE